MKRIRFSWPAFKNTGCEVLIYSSCKGRTISSVSKSYEYNFLELILEDFLIVFLYREMVLNRYDDFGD